MTKPITEAQQDAIYKAFDTVTRDLRVFVLIDTKGGREVVGKVVVKYGASVRAFVHIMGHPMSKGTARGGGYDRATAAVNEAVHRMTQRGTYEGPHEDLSKGLKQAVQDAGSGDTWENTFRAFGLEVFSAC